MISGSSVSYPRIGGLFNKRIFTWHGEMLFNNTCHGLMKLYWLNVGITAGGHISWMNAFCFRPSVRQLKQLAILLLCKWEIWSRIGGTFRFIISTTNLTGSRKFFIYLFWIPEEIQVAWSISGSNVMFFHNGVKLVEFLFEMRFA